MNALRTARLHLVREHELNDTTIYNYTLPEAFDGFNLFGQAPHLSDGQIIINPYQALIETIDAILDMADGKHMDYGLPYFHENPLPFNLSNGNWIQSSIVYSLMIRASTCFDHDRNEKIDHKNLYGLKDSGTFLKTLLLLPHLKRMGVDVLYLLPISKYSLRDKKGEAGSPYAVNNFFELDPNLKDPMTGDQCSVETEFKALVEAAHILGMKVVIDIIPRTNSVSSDFILSHPEWFYWIKLEDKENYGVPWVDGLPEATPPKPDFLPQVFRSPQVRDHLKKFVQDPKTANPKQFEKLIKKYKKGDDPLEFMEKTFGVTIASAFSDHINDPQPAWSDITYFRMFLDNPVNSQPYLDELDFTPAPYLLFDIAKSSLNPGALPNQGLWDMIASVIPYYQENYGIDGARIDMGHALPLELVSLIIKKAKEVDPNFCFIAEEMDVKNDESSIQKGYNMIIGNGFVKMGELSDFSLNEFFYTAPQLKSPLFACGETHDTPRITAREGGKQTAKLVTLLSFFIPNTVPFINSGQEFYEIQPMNLGIGARDFEQWLLDPKDPYYGKLALFDYYSFHMNQPDRFDLRTQIEHILPIREAYLSSLLDPNQCFPLYFDHPHIQAVGVAIKKEDRVLLALASTNIYHNQRLNVHLRSLPNINLDGCRIQQPYSSLQHDLSCEVNSNWNILTIDFYPCEFKLLELIYQ